MTEKVPNKFRSSVFINCPFDEEYKLLLQPMLFTLVYVGLFPRLASEKSDSLEQRIEKILRLIKECKYSIHDLSRLRSQKAMEISRLNMPFELGIDYGCRRIAKNYLCTKRSLILEKTPYDIQKALSDLNGADIKSHNNRPVQAVRALQHWLIETVGLKDIESPSIIWAKYTEFDSDFYKRHKAQGYTKRDLRVMPVPQYIRFIKQWVASNRIQALIEKS
ncbi:MAG TPA: hypothetical protein VFI24_06635 [Pyrinomonadaceae bacterium]|nr:hypothetical protein [Pyrinomonadaceae bacterium]